jgi:hypothetical protein
LKLNGSGRKLTALKHVTNYDKLDEAGRYVYAFHGEQIRLCAAARLELEAAIAKHAAQGGISPPQYQYVYPAARRVRVGVTYTWPHGTICVTEKKKK